MVMRQVDPALLGLPLLAGSAVLPWQSGWACAIGAIVLFGVPHGALDVEIGRTLLRPRLGRAWFPGFSLPYLLVVAAVLAAWQLVPGATLAGFLVVSCLHFGKEEADGFGLEAVARGGLPIAVPVLTQPDATGAVLAATSGLPLLQPPAWLVAASLFWLILAGVVALRLPPRRLMTPLLSVAAFALLPPLTAFGLYFVFVHAPAHVTALIRHPSRAPRVRDPRSAWVLAIPVTALTIGFGAALWPFHAGPGAVRLVGVTLQLLAAFTVPHVLFEAWLDRRDRRPGRQPARTPPVSPLLRALP